MCLRKGFIANLLGLTGFLNVASGHTKTHRKFSLSAVSLFDSIQFQPFFRIFCTNPQKKEGSTSIKKRVVKMENGNQMKDKNIRFCQSINNTPKLVNYQYCIFIIYISYSHTLF